MQILVIPKLRLNLIIEYIDGSCETLVSDKSWKLTADGPIRSNNEYDGERYDARKELGEWTCVGYDDSKVGGSRAGEYSHRYIAWCKWPLI